MGLCSRTRRDVIVGIYKINTLFSDRLARDEHLNQSLLRQLIARGTKLFLNLFLSAFWTSVSSLRRKKVKLFVQWVGGVSGHCMCISDHRAFSQLRDRLYGEAYYLGRSFADAEKHILCETDIAGRNRCYNMSTLTL